MRLALGVVGPHETYEVCASVDNTALHCKADQRDATESALAGLVYDFAKTLGLDLPVTVATTPGADADALDRAVKRLYPGAVGVPPLTVLERVTAEAYELCSTVRSALRTLGVEPDEMTCAGVLSAPSKSHELPRLIDSKINGAIRDQSSIYAGFFTQMRRMFGGDASSYPATLNGVDKMAKEVNREVNKLIDKASQCDALLRDVVEATGGYILPEQMGNRDAVLQVVRECVKPPMCTAHGDKACALCAQTSPGKWGEYKTCTDCEYFEQTGMHWDTCTNRTRGLPETSKTTADLDTLRVDNERLTAALKAAHDALPPATGVGSLESRIKALEPDLRDAAETREALSRLEVFVPGLGSRGQFVPERGALAWAVRHAILQLTWAPGTHVRFTKAHDVAGFVVSLMDKATVSGVFASKPERPIAVDVKKEDGADVRLFVHESHIERDPAFPHQGEILAMNWSDFTDLLGSELDLAARQGRSAAPDPLGVAKELVSALRVGTKPPSRPADSGAWKPEPGEAWSVIDRDVVVEAADEKGGE